MQQEDDATAVSYAKIAAASFSHTCHIIVCSFNHSFVSQTQRDISISASQTPKSQLFSVPEGFGHLQHASIDEESSAAGGGMAQPAAAAHRELSGVFTEPARWAAAWEQLAQPDCPIRSLRVYHNTPEQLAATGRALAANNSLTSLEVGQASDEDGGAAAAELAAALQVNRNLRALSVQQLGPSSTAIFSAALPRCCHLINLSLHGLQPAQLLLLAGALQQSGAAATAAAAADPGGDGGSASHGLLQLQLPNARVDAAAAAALSAALSAHPFLTQLSLASASFENNRDDARNSSTPLAPPASSQQPPLAAAELTACAALLTAGLAAHPSLARLDLQQASGIDAAAVGAFLAARTAALAGSSAAAASAQECNLQEAGLGDAGMELLAAAAQAGSSSGASRQPQQAAGMSGCSRQLLLSLNLRSNGIGTSGASALGRALAGLSTCCSCGSRDDSGAAAAGGAVLGLLLLDLGSNALGSEGLAGLVTGLLGDAAAGSSGAGCQLLQLDLQDNGMKDAQGLALLLTSQAGQTMQALNLSHNCLDDAAVQQLATVAPACSSVLERLDLSSNRIGDGGAVALAQLLAVQPRLLRLQVGKNRVKRAVVEALINAAYAHRALVELGLSGNRTFGDRMCQLHLTDLATVMAARSKGGGRRMAEDVAATKQVAQDVAAKDTAAQAAAARLHGHSQAGLRPSAGDNSGSASRGGGLPSLAGVLLSHHTWGRSISFDLWRGDSTAAAAAAAVGLVGGSCTGGNSPSSSNADSASTEATTWQQDGEPAVDGSLMDLGRISSLAGWISSEEFSRLMSSSGQQLPTVSGSRLCSAGSSSSGCFEGLSLLISAGSSGGGSSCGGSDGARGGSSGGGSPRAAGVVRRFGSSHGGGGAVVRVAGRRGGGTNDGSSMAHGGHTPCLQP